MFLANSQAQRSKVLIFNRSGGITMRTLWFFDIEPHEQRYTSEWQTYLPQQLRQAMAAQPKPIWQLEIVSGGNTSGSVSPAAFLNFAETNIYKSVQIAEFALKVEQGKVKPGDRVLFTDAWHPGIIQCRYMFELLGLPVQIHSMWHAGSYDRHDILGQKLRDKSWSRSFERAVFDACNRNYFATKFHRDLFFKVLNPVHKKRARVVGWPMEYLPAVLKPYIQSKKSKIIIFPHRMSPEKQPKTLSNLSRLLYAHKVEFAQQTPLTKHQYRTLVGKAEAVYSANLQETLGIGVYEALLCGAVPIIPNRLSYQEMYSKWCYPSSWSTTLRQTKKSRTVFAAYIRKAIQTRNPANLQKLADGVGKQYFNGSQLYGSVLRKR